MYPHLAFHVRRIAGWRNLPPDQRTPVHRWLVQLGFGRIDHVGGVGEGLIANDLEIDV